MNYSSREAKTQVHGKIYFLKKPRRNHKAYERANRVRQGRTLFCH